MSLSGYRFHYFGLGPVLVSGLLAFTLTGILWAALQTPERYPDPVVGRLAWDAVNKNCDLRGLVVLLVSVVFLTGTISAISHALASDGPASDLGVGINQFLLFSLVPAGWRLAVACLHHPEKLPPFRFISAFPLGALLVLLMLCRFRGQLHPKDIFAVGGATLLAPVMAAFSAIAIPLAIIRLHPESVNKISLYVGGVTATGTVAAVIGLTAIFLISSDLEILKRRLLHCLAICQCGLPLLLFYLLPSPLSDVGNHFRHPYPVGLVVTLSILAMLGGWRMFRRFRSATIESDRLLVKAISPVSVAMISIFVFCGTSALPDVPADLFHSGESMLPWQQIWDYRAIPYVDFAPVHGLMEILRGALNQLFFDGSFRYCDQAYILVGGIAAAAIALTASELITPLGAMFLLFTVLPDLDRMYFVAPALFIIAAPRLIKMPVGWLAVWLLLGLFSCAYNPALGPAFVLGTIPISIWQGARAVRFQPRWFAFLITAILAVVGIGYGVHLVRQVAIGFVRFILDNQWTNESANGIAWSQGAGLRDTKTGVGSTQFLWEIVRFGWIPVVIAAAVLFWKQCSLPRDKRNIPAMVLAAAVPPMLLLSSLWVIVRLDIGVPGRSGTITQVALFALTPGLLFLTMKRQNAGAATLLLAVFLGFIYPTDRAASIDPEVLVQKPAEQRTIYPEWSIVDGYLAGLPRLGQVIRRDPDVTTDILNFKRDLNLWLKPGETFLDLSDESALYYYLDLPCPVQYAAYVAGNSRLQGEIMQQLKQHPVPVVLISPSGWLDFSPISLRCYRPYHDYVSKYAAVSKDGFIFLVDPSRAPDAGPAGSEPQLKLLDATFRRENLLRLPIAWGESWASLRDRFATVAQIPESQTLSRAPDQTASAEWALPPEINNGQAADFLRLHCEISYANPRSSKMARRKEASASSASDEPQLSLSWTTADGTASAPIVFKSETGDLVIPLGAYPRWLLGHGFHSLHITLQNSNSAMKMILSNLQFMRLKPL